MEIEVNGKTLSINHYVNYNLKSKKKIGGKSFFRLYTQVVYESKNTKFKSFDNISNSILYGLKEGEEIEESILYRKYSDLMKVDSIILELAKNEILEKKNNFNLKGFSKRLKIYFSEINDFIPNAIYQRLINFLGDKFTFNEFSLIFHKADTIPGILDILTERYDNIIDEMPTRMQGAIRIYQLFERMRDEGNFKIKCYEWMQGKKELVIEQLIKKEIGLKRESISVLLSIVDELIVDELKMTEK